MIRLPCQMAFDEGRGRTIVWFSRGAASAVAAKLAVEKHSKENLEIVYCDTSNDEDPDNQRFHAEVEQSGFSGPSRPSGQSSIKRQTRFLRIRAIFPELTERAAQGN